MFFRTMYNYDREKASDETGLECKDESLADQSMKDEADINTLVRRFGLTGQLPEALPYVTNVDVTGVGTFRELMDIQLKANESFLALPADVRSRFNNDPALFVDFCSDEANLDEMRKLGLAVAKPSDDSGKSVVDGA